MSKAIPPKGKMCPRTFARNDGPLECRTLVSDHGCDLWQSVSEIVDRDPDTGEAIGKDRFGCIEGDIKVLWMKDTLRRQLQTTATIDKLSKEVAQNNAGAMGALLGGINHTLQQIAEAPPALANGSGDQKLIGN